MCRGITSVALAAVMTLSGTVASASDTYTKRVRGDGNSSFGFALMYARWDARAHARADGFTDPDHQCKEVLVLASPYIATVFWDCTREL